MERVSPWELEPEQADAAPRGDEARRAEEAASRAARASALAARRCAQSPCPDPQNPVARFAGHSTDWLTAERGSDIVQRVP